MYFSKRFYTGAKFIGNSEMKDMYCYCCGGVRLCLCGTAAANAPLSNPQMMHEWEWSSGGMILTGKTEGFGERHVTVALCSLQVPRGTGLHGQNFRISPDPNRGAFGLTFPSQKFILKFVFLTAPKPDFLLFQPEWKPVYRRSALIILNLIACSNA
jgi:hypothetical protein